MLLSFFLFVWQVSSVPPSCTVSTKLPLSSVSDANYCPFIWASSLSTPRGFDIAQNGDLLVLERGQAQITALWDDDSDGVSGPTERAVLARQTGLNHGIVISRAGGFVYASTASEVYRWRYTSGTRTNLGTSERIITGIPSSGHTTRTLILSPDESQLYVSLGSANNIDDTPIQAMIRRWNVTRFSSTALAWTTGEMFADGLRNEVALAFDARGRFWGVENGVDNTQRSDWGGDIHNQNPCEELNLFTDQPVGAFYGYPYCWSEGELPSPPGQGPKTQWVDEKFRTTAPYSDAWCQNRSNVVPPYACFDAHTAPLDIVFGNITDASAYDMTAYIAFHGSWNRQPADGYRVEYVTFNGANVNRVRLLEYQGPGATGSGWIRPVGVGIKSCKWGSCLFVSSDTTGQIISIAYGVNVVIS